MSSLWISETELLAPLRPQPPVESPPFIHQSTIDDSDNPQSEEYGEEEDAEAPAPAPVALSQPKLDAQHVLSVAGFEVSAKRDRRLLADEQDLIHEALVTEVLRSRRVAAKIRHIFGCDAAAEAPASGEVVVFDETTMQLVCDSWAGPHSGYAPTSFAHLKNPDHNGVGLLFRRPTVVNKKSTASVSFPYGVRRNGGGVDELHVGLKTVFRVNFTLRGRKLGPHHRLTTDETLASFGKITGDDETSLRMRLFLVRDSPPPYSTTPAFTSTTEPLFADKSRLVRGNEPGGRFFCHQNSNAKAKLVRAADGSTKRLFEFFSSDLLDGTCTFEGVAFAADAQSSAIATGTRFFRLYCTPEKKAARNVPALSAWTPPFLLIANPRSSGQFNEGRCEIAAPSS